MQRRILFTNCCYFFPHGWEFALFSLNPIITRQCHCWALKASARILLTNLFIFKPLLGIAQVQPLLQGEKRNKVLQIIFFISYRPALPRESDIFFLPRGCLDLRQSGSCWGNIYRYLYGAYLGSYPAGLLFWVPITFNWLIIWQNVWTACKEVAAPPLNPHLPASRRRRRARC